MYFKKEIPAENINKYLASRLEANIGFAQSDMSYLGEYENAIDIIFNFIVENKHNVDTVATPLLYLMRHSIELGLKMKVIGVGETAIRFASARHQSFSILLGLPVSGNNIKDNLRKNELTEKHISLEFTGKSLTKFADEKEKF